MVTNVLVRTLWPALTAWHLPRRPHRRRHRHLAQPGAARARGRMPRARLRLQRARPRRARVARGRRRAARRRRASRASTGSTSPTRASSSCSSTSTSSRTRPRRSARSTPWSARRARDRPQHRLARLRRELPRAGCRARRWTASADRRGRRGGGGRARAARRSAPAGWRSSTPTRERAGAAGRALVGGAVGRELERSRRRRHRQRDADRHGRPRRHAGRRASCCARDCGSRTSSTGRWRPSCCATPAPPAAARSTAAGWSSCRPRARSSCSPARARPRADAAPLRDAGRR